MTDEAGSEGATVVILGRCACCLRMSVACGRSCGACKEAFGERIAELIARVRAEPRFALRCFRQLSTRHRRFFVAIFGDPRRV